MSDPVTKEAPVKTAWWLVRHGPVINPDNLIYGRSDRAISTKSMRIYASLAEMLPRSAIYLTSKLGRTVATLKEVARIGGFPPPPFEQIANFDEQSFGDWEGQSWDALFKEGRSRTFWRTPAGERPPGGESFEDVMERVAVSLWEQTLKYRGQSLVLFAHGGTIRAALAEALGLDGAKALRFSIDNCSITRLNHFTPPHGLERWQVVQVNISPSGSK